MYCISRIVLLVLLVILLLTCVANNPPLVEHSLEYESSFDFTKMYRDGLLRIIAGAHSPGCQRLIEEEYMRQIQAVVFEKAHLFEDVMFHSQCPSIGSPFQLPYLTKEAPKRVYTIICSIFLSLLSFLTYHPVSASAVYLSSNL